jgi:hypothetical protein
VKGSHYEWDEVEGRRGEEEEYMKTKVIADR